MEPGIKDLLVKARELITEKEHWTTEAYGRSVSGSIVVRAQLKKASCFCATGALIRAWQAIGNLGVDEYLDAVGLLEKSMEMNILIYNDSHTHEEVLNAFDQVIQTVSSD